MKKFKIIFFTFATLIAFFMPIFPATLIDNNDPKVISDERVLANISESDLHKITNTVRSELSISIYEILLLEPRHSLENVSDSKPTKRYKKINNETIAKNIPAIGKVVVTIGFNCKNRCSTLNIFYLDKYEGKWNVVEKSVVFI